MIISGINSLSDLQAPQTMVASPGATYQDWLNVPPLMRGQLVDGVLYTHPTPPILHGHTRTVLSFMLGPPFHSGDGGPGGWWLLGSLNLRFNENYVEPDLVGWRRSRMPVFPDELCVSLAPDWVCEVLSDSTREFDLGIKREVYARAGVAYQWILDPWERWLEAYHLIDTEWVLIDKQVGDVSVSLPPFEAIRLNLGDLWIPTSSHTVPDESPGRSKS